MSRMNRLLTILELVIMGSPLAFAAAVPNGAQVAARHGCAACHGAKGEGMPGAVFPRLAGQPAAYLDAQLQAFANGERANAVMQAQAKPLSMAEMRALSSYYAGLQTPVAAGQTHAGKPASRRREIVVNGLWQKNIPGCESCHGPGARGNGLFPGLAGQNAQYTEAQFADWQAGKRPGGPDGLMKHIADSLDASQVHAAAQYLSSLPPNGPPLADTEANVAPTVADAIKGFFQPPLEKDLPKGEFGDSVKRGYLIFTRTPKYAGEYIASAHSCSNCHLNRGRQANSAPMWAAWGMYPAYRSKNKEVNNFFMRLQGCFEYSENAPESKVGHAPPADSKIMVDLESYLYWMSQGVPTGKRMRGRGYPRLADPPKPFSRERGKQVYAAGCAVCHGENGQGHKVTDGSYDFPPLWGPKAYNWGAGMHAVNTAAAFIEHNMPLGDPGKLDLQDAWNVAAWIDSHPRPQDPRYKGNLAETIKRFHHERKVDYYGKQVDGRVLGAPGTLEAWEKAHNGK